MINMVSIFIICIIDKQNSGIVIFVCTGTFFCKLIKGWSREDIIRNVAVFAVSNNMNKHPLTLRVVKL